MSRRGNLRRCLTVLLALLMVTPHAVLRPCCCSRDAVGKTEVGAAGSRGAKSAVSARLRPCCLKRLQGAQAAATTLLHATIIERFARASGEGKDLIRVREKNKSSEARLKSRSPGVHDSSQCRCRSMSEMARSTRTVLRSITNRQLNTWIHVSISDQYRVRVASRDLIATIAVEPPDGRADYSIRLCRWLV